jgi:hypothetical protein
MEGEMGQWDKERIPQGTLCDEREYWGKNEVFIILNS